jgi:DNA-directed RNA polymerase specialized sigma24 family protein
MVQEAYLRLVAYQRTERVRDMDSLLRCIVLNLSFMHYRREVSAPFAYKSIEKAERRWMLVDPAPSPERTLAAELELDGVANMLSATSRRTCQIAIAQHSGYSYEEISAAFAIKPRTVEKHVALAREMLSGERRARRPINPRPQQ